MTDEGKQRWALIFGLFLAAKVQLTPHGFWGQISISRNPLNEEEKASTEFEI
jgi:hypothetical protein